MQFGGRYGFGSVSVRIRCICETALMLIVKVRLLSHPGNSLSAILDGTAKLTFLKRGEDYYITMPYAHCKGKIIITPR